MFQRFHFLDFLSLPMSSYRNLTRLPISYRQRPFCYVAFFSPTDDEQIFYNDSDKFVTYLFCQLAHTSYWSWRCVAEKTSCITNAITNHRRASRTIISCIKTRTICPSQVQRKRRRQIPVCDHLLSRVSTTKIGWCMLDRIARSGGWWKNHKRHWKWHPPWITHTPIGNECRCVFTNVWH